MALRKEPCQPTVVPGAPQNRRQGGSCRQRGPRWCDKSKTAQGMLLTIDGPMILVSAIGSLFQILIARP
jgi:hypothetical protein